VTTPNAVVRRWIAAFNARNVDMLTALCRADATNHQVARDPEGVRGCGFFHVIHGHIALQAAIGTG